MVIHQIYRTVYWCRNCGARIVPRAYVKTHELPGKSIRTHDGKPLAWFHIDGVDEGDDKLDVVVDQECQVARLRDIFKKFTWAEPDTNSAAMYFRVSEGGADQNMIFEEELPW